MIHRKREHVLTGHGVEEPVLGTVHARWPDDGGFREGITDGSLSSVFRSVECRGRVGRSVQVRDVDQAGYTDIRADFGDPLGSPGNQSLSCYFHAEVYSLDVDVLVCVVSTSQWLTRVCMLIHCSTHLVSWSLPARL
jgi:hypothetical protein